MIGMSSLRAMPLFSGMSEHDLESILKIGELRAYEPGEAVVHRGEAADALFVVLRGSAEVDVEDVAHALQPGNFFGEMALVSGKPRTATVKAVEPLQTLRIGAEDFQRFLLQHPQVGLAMLKSVIDRWRDVQERLEAWSGTG
jgi:CRP-like cAMP-binding protein